MTKTITCIDCSVEVECKRTTRKRCDECRTSKRREWTREWARKNPRSRRESMARWRTRNPEKDAANSAKYREANLEKLRRYWAEYRDENPGKTREHSRRKRERDSSIDPSRMGERWVPAEDAMLLEWTGGARELGAVLGRTRASVQGRKALLREKGLID